MIASTPSAERPRERLARAGASALSIRELLALLLGSGPKGEGCLGLAARILAYLQVDGSDCEEHAWFQTLEHRGDEALLDIPGLGPAGRARIVAGFELAKRYDQYRKQLEAESPRPQTVSLSALERQALMQIPWDLRLAHYEWCGFVPVSRRGLVAGLRLVARGTGSSVNVDIQELFAKVLSAHSLGMFLFHNHPSGDLQASDADHIMTERVRSVATGLGIEFFGHWIVSRNGQRLI